uniref:Uncharacterized protein n=1 Tax=Romanomermis culicivorax TaxID=13658 RepID=A0A915L7Z7_ROMCU
MGRPRNPHADADGGYGLKGACGIRTFLAVIPDYLHESVISQLKLEWVKYDTFFGNRILETLDIRIDICEANSHSSRSSLCKRDEESEDIEKA